MSAPIRLHATRSSANPAVTLYTVLTEDPPGGTSGSTSTPQRPKRANPGDCDERYPTNSSVRGTILATRNSGQSTKYVKVEHVAGTNAEDETAPAKRRTKSPRPRAPKKQKPIQRSLDEPHPTPEHWKEQYDTIKSMRSRVRAPVDTMGCDQAQRGETDPKVPIC